MAERPRFFDDLAGVAGGAMSAFAGLREELEAMVRARMDEMIRKLDLVRREELDAVTELAANARAGQEAADTRISVLEERIVALESREASPPAFIPPSLDEGAVSLDEELPGEAVNKEALPPEKRNDA
jgi:BMFP domain-containing protein YqiC